MRQSLSDEYLVIPMTMMTMTMLYLDIYTIDDRPFDRRWIGSCIDLEPYLFSTLTGSLHRPGIYLILPNAPHHNHACIDVLVQ